jgi:hypothetical protein
MFFFESEPAFWKGKQKQNHINNPKQNPPRGRVLFFSILFYFTASFNPFPDLNLGTFLAAILIVAPV